MFSDLPELILDLVCDHLSYEDVLALRCVCKGLKEFIDRKSFTKLNLFVRKYSYYHRLFYTGKWICYPHSFHSDLPIILSSARFREQFACVRRMIICMDMWNIDRSRDGFEIDLNRLNCFKELRHLEVDKFDSINGKLSLPELRIASFRAYAFKGPPESLIELDCPRLRALRIEWLRLVLTENTNQLDYLQYDDSLNQGTNLKSISSNLRKLSTICFGSGEQLVRFFSDLNEGRLKLPSLDRIKLQSPLPSTTLEQLDELVDCLEDLHDRTSQIEFSICDRPIRSPDELRQIVRLLEADDSETATSLRFRILKDRSFQYLNEKPELNFLLSAASSVELNEDLEWPEEALTKLKGRNIGVVAFRERFRASISTFELFARNCYQTIYGLALQNQTVTGRLLEMLSRHLLNLIYIQLFNCGYETLKPLAKFRNLEKLAFDFEPSMEGSCRDELTFIYEKSRTLEDLTIFSKVLTWQVTDERVIIKLLRTTTGPKVHRLQLNRHPPQDRQFDSLHAMIDFLSTYWEPCLLRGTVQFEATDQAVS